LPIAARTADRRTWSDGLTPTPARAAPAGRTIASPKKKSGQAEPRRRWCLFGLTLAEVGVASSINHLKEKKRKKKDIKSFF